MDGEGGGPQQNGTGLQQLPKLLGDAEAAAKVFREYKRFMFGDETQNLFNEKMDFKDPNCLVELKKVQLHTTYLTLDSLGLGHLKPMFGLDKIPDLLTLFLMAYGDCPEACVVGGTLGALARDYRTQVDLLAVYLQEAHAEGVWDMGSNNSYMKQHESLKDRITAAKDLLRVDSENSACLTDDIADLSKFRLVVDQMDNLFTKMFDAHPDRVIFVHGGKVAFMGKEIIAQLATPKRLMTHEARDWLEANVGPAKSE